MICFHFLKVYCCSFFFVSVAVFADILVLTTLGSKFTSRVHGCTEDHVNTKTASLQEYNIMATSNNCAKRFDDFSCGIK